MRYLLAAIVVAVAAMSCDGGGGSSSTSWVAELTTSPEAGSPHECWVAPINTSLATSVGATLRLIFHEDGSAHAEGFLSADMFIMDREFRWAALSPRTMLLIPDYLPIWSFQSIYIAADGTWFEAELRIGAYTEWLVFTREIRT